MHRWSLEAFDIASPSAPPCKLQNEAAWHSASAQCERCHTSLIMPVLTCNADGLFRAAMVTPMRAHAANSGRMLLRLRTLLRANNSYQAKAVMSKGHTQLRSA